MKLTNGLAEHHPSLNPRIARLHVHREVGKLGGLELKPWSRVEVMYIDVTRR